jgi:hypothetical protein
MTTFSRMQKLAGLQEIGDAKTPPYKFKSSDKGQEPSYVFVTDQGIEYVAKFDTFDDFEGFPITEFSFKTKNGTDDEVVNKGELYKVMSTITAILLDYTKRHNPVSIGFTPTKNTGDDMRRANLYRAFIAKNLPPGYSLDEQAEVSDDTIGNTFTIINDELWAEYELYLDDEYGDMQKDWED